ncbi:hypothetical protein IG197_07350 [Aminobacter sp. SR38]|jgi:hypothetical protein|uniref:hypothetical protein n=1 Tax=Aminobacter sp. SR38 TaxID=2774562 RepID=UPI00177B4D48|nr:hypothetical protein [Aminobacter sp. SR38]QOF72867.1 hypothetical protein IG197_07350 [Aminobacter sp. SR38]
MLANGMADSAQLTILTRAVDDYCAKYRIAGGRDREEVATRVMALFRRGISDSRALAVALEKSSGSLHIRAAFDCGRLSTVILAATVA